MHSRKLLYVLLVLMFALGVAACDQGSSPSIQPLANGNLTQALAFTPISKTLDFTDWTLLKKYMGLESLTANRTESETKELLDRLGSQAPIGFPDASELTVSENPLQDRWSFDVTDLAWSAFLETYVEASPPVRVLRFRDNFDFAPLIAHFKERGFTEEDYGGAKIYSHDLDPTLDWQSSLFEMLNTAMLADKKMLVMSTEKKQVQAILDAAKAGGSAVLSGDSAVTELVNKTGEVGSAAILPSSSACPYFSVPSRAAASAITNQLKSILDNTAQQLHKFDVFVTGYRYEGRDSLGFVALHFASPDDAKADVALRQQLLAKGMSFQISKGEAYDQLISARKGTYTTEADGNDVLMKFKGQFVPNDVSGEANSLPSLLYRMWAVRDMLFATCP